MIRIIKERAPLAVFARSLIFTVIFRRRKSAGHPGAIQVAYPLTLAVVAGLVSLAAANAIAGLVFMAFGRPWSAAALDGNPWPLAIAAVVWGVWLIASVFASVRWAGPWHVRRTVAARIRRGQCPRCAYPNPDQALRCPECGTNRPSPSHDG